MDGELRKKNAQAQLVCKILIDSRQFFQSFESHQTQTTRVVWLDAFNYCNSLVLSVINHILDDKVLSIFFLWKKHFSFMKHIGKQKSKVKMTTLLQTGSQSCLGKRASSIVLWKPSSLYLSSLCYIVSERKSHSKKDPKVNKTLGNDDFNANIARVHSTVFRKKERLKSSTDLLYSSDFHLLSMIDRLSKWIELSRIEWKGEEYISVHEHVHNIQIDWKFHDMIVNFSFHKIKLMKQVEKNISKIIKIQRKCRITNISE
jgi:hypothetical protein